MINAKDRLDLILRIMARKHRPNVDVDINGKQPIYQARGMIHKLLITLNRIDLLSDSNFRSIEGKLW